MGDKLDQLPEDTAALLVLRDPLQQDQAPAADQFASDAVRRLANPGLIAVVLVNHRPPVPSEIAISGTDFGLTELPDSQRGAMHADCANGKETSKVLGLLLELKKAAAKVHKKQAPAPVEAAEPEPEVVVDLVPVTQLLRQLPPPHPDSDVLSEGLSGYHCTLSAVQFEALEQLHWRLSRGAASPVLQLL